MLSPVQGATWGLLIHPSLLPVGKRTRQPAPFKAGSSRNGSRPCGPGLGARRGLA